MTDDRIQVPGSTLARSASKARRFNQRGRESSARSLNNSARKTPLKPSQPKRDWTDARIKVRHACCRLCADTRVEAAHVIGREHDRPKTEGASTLWVNPDAVIPLCRAHHTLFDAHQVDVLPVLTLEEQLRAVEDAGGIELARRRTCPTAYRVGRDGFASAGQEGNDGRA